MDTLLNAGMAAGFTSAKGKKIKSKGVNSSGAGFDTFGDDINNALDSIGSNHDVIWIDTMAVPRSSSWCVLGAIIYYVER